MDQVRNDLLASVRSGKLNEGGKLPNEYEPADRLAVSRATVRGDPEATEVEALSIAADPRPAKLLDIERGTPLPHIRQLDPDDFGNTVMLSDE